MMKHTVFVLFFSIFSVQSKITSLNETLLMRVGDTTTLYCDTPKTKWKLGADIVANCKTCPSTCDVYPPLKGHVTASCNKTHSILNFHSTELVKSSLLKCPSGTASTFKFLLGNYDKHLHPENNRTFALAKENYTLLCDNKKKADIRFINQTGDVFSSFTSDCKNISYDYDINKLNTTCEQHKARLQIKSVTLKDDGQIFGCESLGRLSLYRLTVNLAVKIVIIRQPSKILIENKEEIFICEAGNSKPVPSYTWITVDKDNKKKNQTEFNITRTRIGKVWKTTSYLKLKLKKTYKSIFCKAKIKETRWKKSKSQSLDIQYPPEITVFSKNVTKLEQKAKINCLAQGNPNNINYRLVQKWGKTIKRQIETNEKDFNNLSFGDLGTWTCQASNGIPKGDYCTEKSVDIKVKVPAHLQGDKNEITTVASTKELKTCFYCNPKATEMKWYKGNEEISSNRTIYLPAEDGWFPFAGNCIILKLDVKEKGIQMYSLHVTNPAGKKVFKVTLDSAHRIMYIIIGCIIAVLIIISLIAGVFFIRQRRSKNKRERNNNLHRYNSADDMEMADNTLYAEATHITTHEVAHPEPLYANRPLKIPKEVNNVAHPEPLYANRPRKIPKEVNNDVLPREENLEMKEKKADKRELLYAALDFAPDFTPDKTENEEDSTELNEGQTVYTSIDFL